MLPQDKTKLCAYFVIETFMRHGYSCMEWYHWPRNVMGKVLQEPACTNHDITLTSHEHHSVSIHRLITVQYFAVTVCLKVNTKVPYHWPFVWLVNQWPIYWPHKAPVTGKFSYITISLWVINSLWSSEAMQRCRFRSPLEHVMDSRLISWNNTLRHKI